MNNRFLRDPSLQPFGLTDLPTPRPTLRQGKCVTQWATPSIIVSACLGLLLLFSGCQRSPSEVASTHPPFNPLMAGVVQNPIMEPEIKRTGELEEKDFLADEDLVLGVEVNGEHRAYPINQLTGPKRELINDYLGGEPILVTW